MPVAPCPCLPVLQFAISVHDDPSYCSTLTVLPGSIQPPIDKAAVCIPQPAAKFVFSFKSAFSAQLVPFHSSVSCLLVPPPSNPAVDVPAH